MHIFVLAGLALVLSGTLSCQRSENQTLKKQEALSAISFSNLMASVKPWPTDSDLRNSAFGTSALMNYTNQDWVHLVAVARIVQRSDPDSVEAAMRVYLSSSKLPGDSMEHNLKLLLLLRIVFELPTSVKGNISFPPGLAGNPMNADGSLNQSWPIDWNGGRPRFIAGYDGFEGIQTSYGPADEYAAFLRMYSFRDLSNFSVTTEDY